MILRKLDNNKGFLDKLFCEIKKNGHIKRSESIYLYSSLIYFQSGRSYLQNAIRFKPFYLASQGRRGELDNGGKSNYKRVRKDTIDETRPVR